MILPGTYSNGFAPRDGEPLYPSLWRGCVGAWNPGLGPSGLTLRDHGPYKNHGTLTNMVPGTDWVTSQGRYALDFDAVNDFVDLDAPASGLSGDFAVSLWFRASNLDSAYRLLWETNGYRQMTGGIAIYQNSASIEIWRELSGFLQLINATNVITANAWTHLVLSRLAGAMSLRTNSTQIGTASNTQNFDAGNLTNKYNLGGGRTQFFFLGQLDDIRIFDRALSPNEIRLLATRRGIAYEMAPRRRTAAVAAAPPTTFRRRQQYQQLVGGGAV